MKINLANRNKAILRDPQKNRRANCYIPVHVCRYNVYEQVILIQDHTRYKYIVYCLHIIFADLASAVINFICEMESIYLYWNVLTIRNNSKKYTYTCMIFDAALYLSSTKERGPKIVHVYEIC